MGPRFSSVTRLVAAVFVIAGVGAVIAGLSAGEASDQLILLALAVGFLVIGGCLWMEYLWAWWAGVGVSAFTVVMVFSLRLPTGSGVFWFGVVALFVVSAIQGRVDRSHRLPRR